MDARKSFSMNIKLFTLIGLWLSQKNSTIRKIYYFYSTCLIGLFFTSFLMSQTIYMVTVWGNVEEMVGVLFLMVTILGEYVKMYCLLLTPKRVNNLLDDLQKPCFQPRNEVQKDILRKGSKIVKLNSGFFIISCLTVASFWGLYPILDGTYKDFNLPMAVWIPFEKSYGNRFPYVYSYTYCGILLSAFVNSSYDTFFTGFMIHVGIQLDILTDNLQNITLDKIKKPYLEEEFLEKIIKCIQHYMEIMRFTREMESIFTNGAFAEFCAAGFVLVVTLFQMTLISPVSLQFVMLASYLFCIMYQLFVYCWFGNEITLKSMNLLGAVYKGDWYICGHRKYRRIILLFMVRLQKPIVVTANNFIPLSIDTFTTIVKSSWSYFNLLRQTNSKL